MSNKLPFVSSDIPRDLRNFIDRLREIIVGSGTDRFVTAKDLISSGVVTTGPGGSLVKPTEVVVGTPATPQNVTASAAIQNVIITWDAPNYTGHAYAEVWSAATDEIGVAVKLGLAPGEMYVDSIGPSATRYYWVRFVNILSTAGPFNSVNGTLGQTGSDVSYMLETLTNAALSPTSPYSKFAVRADFFFVAPAMDFNQEATPTATATGDLWYKPSTEATKVWDGSTWASFSTTLPFIVNTATQTINGVSVPPGVYMDAAFIKNGTITNAKIGNAVIDTAKIADLAVSTAKIDSLAVTTAKIDSLAVTNAKIASLDAAKITTGYLASARIDAGTITATQLSVSTLSSITANIGTITSGTLTGTTIQTASSGARIVMNASGNNKLQAYNSGGSSVVEIGGNTGSVYATAQSGVAAIYGDGSSLNSGGYFLASGSSPACQGINSSAEGVKGTASTSGSNNHGVRGTNSSTGSSGLVGPSNGYDFYADGSGTNYGPFTGTHDSLVLPDGVFEIGDIVIDQQIIERNGVSATIAQVARSAAPNQQGALGVVCALPSSLTDQRPSVFTESIEQVDGETVVTMKPSFAAACSSYQFMPVNSLGEGQINVCGEGGDFETGDLIVTSSMPGKGMKQADDIVRSYTVAKVREPVTFSSPTEVKQVACIYMCG